MSVWSAGAEPELAQGLAALIEDAGHRNVSVTVEETLTAGANRETLKISLVTDGVDELASAIAQIATKGDEETTFVDATTEAEVIRQAGRVGVPVAEVLAAGWSAQLEADVLISRRVDGQTIPRRVLRALNADAGDGDRLTRLCGEALARLHAVACPADQPPYGSLPSYTAGSYLDHLTDRLEQLAEPHPVFRFAIGLLQRTLRPDPDVPSIVHGDFRLGNLIIAEANLQAVVDWEICHLGDPMEDLAWLCLRTWRFGNDELPVGGFGTLARLREAYVGAGGVWTEESFKWWTIARTIWWGIGLAHQAAAYLDGRSTSLVHAASGRRVVELEYDLLWLLDPLVR